MLWMGVQIYYGTYLGISIDKVEGKVSVFHNSSPLEIPLLRRPVVPINKPSIFSPKKLPRVIREAVLWRPDPPQNQCSVAYKIG